MIIPTPKFSVGDAVYILSDETRLKKHECPDCLGTKTWKLMSPVGGEFNTPCPRCQVNFHTEDSLGLTYYVKIKIVKALFIADIRINSSDAEQYGSVLTYVANEDGRGRSGWVLTEDKIISDRQSACELAAKFGEALVDNSDLSAIHEVTGSPQTLSARLDIRTSFKRAIEREMRNEIEQQIRSEFLHDEPGECTPGMWYVDDKENEPGRYNYTIRSADGSRYSMPTICSGGYSQDKCGPGNAYLIAAAKDFRDACDPALLREIAAIRILSSPNDIGYQTRLREMASKMEAAIAKSTPPIKPKADEDGQVDTD